jgi:hypothetical protein
VYGICRRVEGSMAEYDGFIIEPWGRVYISVAWCGGDDVNHRPVENPKRKI